jgi:hypothetical protein
MNILIMLLIVAVTTFEYLGTIHVLPFVAKYVPDILSALVLVLVVVHGTRNRFQHLRAAYWFAFGAMALTMVSGALANSLQPGPLFTGVRSYLRAVPLFLLPAVYEFSERDIRRQLMLVLALCVPQFPIAIGQWFATRTAGGFTGDRTVGTLQLSGNLSVFLICVACVLTAAWLRKRMALPRFLPLLLLVLAPTTINETKATVVLLPVGLLVTFLAAAPRGARLKNAILAAALISLFAAIFIPVYDTYGTGRKHGTPIVEFFSNKETLDKYIGGNASVGAPAHEVGRVDAIVTPLKEMSKDPTHFAIGLGIGNAAHSPLGEQFTGEYFGKFGPFLLSSASVFILEIGVLGLALTFTVDYLIYRDACAVAEADRGLVGALAAGWAGVTAVIVIATFYIVFGACDAISFPFWYFSGLVAAHRMRLIPARPRPLAPTSAITGKS